MFDRLYAREQIRIHSNVSEQQQAIAEDVLAARRVGTSITVVADTREHVAALNATIRAQLTVAGLVDDRGAVTTRAGERIGIGDVIATRRNDRGLNVANRDTWTVSGIDRHGNLSVIDSTAGERVLPAPYVSSNVELAYATTVHGAQGDTTTSAHLVLGEHTGAASAYVGMTRGRQANTAHLIADSIEQAREHWVVTFGRDRADLGPAHAAQDAARETARYALGRPVEQVLAELRDAWESEARCRERVDRAIPIHDQLTEIVALRRGQSTQLAPVAERYELAKRADADAKARAEHSEAVIAAHTGQIHDALWSEWNSQRGTAREHARVALAGPGRFGLRLAGVNRATEELARWSIHWQPVLSDMPTSTRQIAHYADRSDYEANLHNAFDRYARQHAEQAHPDHRKLLNTVEAAGREREQAWRVLSETRIALANQLTATVRSPTSTTPNSDSNSSTTTSPPPGTSSPPP